MYKQKSKQWTRKGRIENGKKYKCITLSNEVLLSLKSILYTAKRMMNLSVFYVCIKGSFLRKNWTQ